MTDHDTLVMLLATRSARKGTFTLASGRTSTLYIDARVTTMHPDGLTTIGPLGVSAIRNTGWKVDSVGGLTLGADPIAYAISYASGIQAFPLRAFTVRKEVKVHGTSKLIEGAFIAGDHVVIIEDVITSGGSALRAIESVRQAGGIISGVLALVDRQEGGSEAIAGQGIPVVSLTTASEILACLP